MASNPFNLSVGSVIWVFGGSDRPRVDRVASETSRSWVLGDGTKVPKAHTRPVFEVQPTYGFLQRYCLTRDAANGQFLLRQSWAMAQRVRECNDATTLRKVAEALGMPVSVPAGGEGA